LDCNWRFFFCYTMGMQCNKWVLRPLIFILAAWAICYALLVVTFRPSHDRDWELGHEALPHITYSPTSTMVTIENFRNFAWTDVMAAQTRYETRTFDLEKLEGVDVFISHFDDFEGLAHIFLSFGFSDGEQVVVSLETRREADEEFSPLLGILRQFEIIYVVGSESDIAGIRTGYRGERVYLYPTIANAEQARALFDQLASKINDIYTKPRMYNTLTHNCTNELTRPVERISEVNFPITWKSILPGYFDEVLYDLDLIDTTASFEMIKQQHFLDNTQLDETSPTYSQDMRRQIISKNAED
jgi:hypothetical protein